MNPKIIKNREIIQSKKKKIAALQNEVRALEAKNQELENTEIVGMVRAQGMTLENFTALLQSLKASGTVLPKEETANAEE